MNLFNRFIPKSPIISTFTPHNSVVYGSMLSWGTLLIVHGLYCCGETRQRINLNWMHRSHTYTTLVINSRNQLTVNIDPVLRFNIVTPCRWHTFRITAFLWGSSGWIRLTKSVMRRFVVVLIVGWTRVWTNRWVARVMKYTFHRTTDSLRDFNNFFKS